MYSYSIISYVWICHFKFLTFVSWNVSSDCMHSFFKESINRRCAFDHDKQHINAAKGGNRQLDLGWSQSSSPNQVLARGLGILFHASCAELKLGKLNTKFSQCRAWHNQTRSSLAWSMADFLRGRIRIAKCVPWSSWLGHRWSLLVGNRHFRPQCTWQLVRKQWFLRKLIIFDFPFPLCKSMILCFACVMFTLHFTAGISIWIFV